MSITRRFNPRTTAALVAACVWFSIAPGVVAADAGAPASLPDFEALVDTQGATVVNIRTEREAGPAPANFRGGPDPRLPEFLQRFREFGMPGERMQRPPASAIGSGVIASADGYVLTNAHVVDGAAKVIVRLHDRREFEARVVGTDEHTDVALLKIEADNLPAATFGDSDDLAVGQWVLAIGAPFGLDQTATQGIVSAVSRSLPNDSYVPFIQTDVALNPGNSGGPLFNTRGEVIGINSQIFSRTGGYMGLSFAIPINLASSIADQLKTNGRIARGWLGVSIQDLDQALAESFRLDKPAGALVSSVSPDGPAHHAGLRAGDVITSYNGHAIERSAALPPLVAATPAASAVPVTVWRGGRAVDLSVTVGLLPSVAQAAPDATPGPLGAVVSDLTPTDRRAHGVENGVRVERVAPGKAAADAGLAADDVIVSFNHESVDNVAELVEMTRAVEPGATVPVLVQRDGRIRFLALRMPERATG